MITPTTPKPVRNQKPKYVKNIASSLSTSGKSGVNHDPNPKEPNKQKRSGPTDSRKCLFCGQRCKLDDCQDFCKKPFSERRDLFFRERLCMGCAISKSHQVKDCKERSKCKTCSGMHPTCLHKEQSQVDVVVSNCVSVCMLPDQGSGFDHTLIVPVWVRPVGQPEKEILQYAVLDDHSNVSFVSQTLCERFHLDGPSTELLLTTMQEQNARAERKNKNQQDLRIGSSGLPQRAKEIIDPEKVLRVLETDFAETSDKKKPYSVEDERFLRKCKKKQSDGRYEMPLPLKTDNACLPNNRQLAVKRWNQLNARFKKNPKFFADYQTFMKDLTSQWAERVPTDRLEVQDGKVNYVPHAGVYHPKKPGQIRVVFDCSAQYNGVSLNDYLLQGPDFMNDLLGILCRFRQESVAFMTDIKSMFHKFVVSEEHRDLLRFFWWLNGDPSKEVAEYRMKAHLFGASSSQGWTHFGLRRAADDGEEEFGADAATFIRKNFYVDDGLKSVPTVSEAIHLIKASQGTCEKACLRLYKIVSNKKEVLEAIPAEDHAKGIKELNLAVDPLPIESALGVM
ncbi:uncharacterized protein [Montipora foliosa]|uniref:uncharacterized protein n=1 Tax=Montipora foliosa TaxID=591990 RepID=UPI0035F0FE7E